MRFHFVARYLTLSSEFLVKKLYLRPDFFKSFCSSFELFKKPFEDRIYCHTKPQNWLIEIRKRRVYISFSPHTFCFSLKLHSTFAFLFLIFQEGFFQCSLFFLPTIFVDEREEKRASRLNQIWSGRRGKNN